MKNEELELFLELKISKTYIRRLDNWVFIDDIKRENFEMYRSHNYRMVINLKSSRCFDSNSVESQTCKVDKDAKPITVDDYFKVAQIIRNNGLFLYNKKLGKTINKNRETPKK